MQFEAEVVGQHAAHFVRADRLLGLTAEQLPKSVDEAAKLFVTVPNGGSIDLLTLKTAEQVAAPE